MPEPKTTIKILVLILMICLECALIAGMDLAVRAGLPIATGITWSVVGGIALGMLTCYALLRC